MTPDQLQRVVPNAPLFWVVALAEEMPKYGINTPRRCAAVVGQILHESAGLTRFVENLNYSDPVRIAKIFRRAFDLDGDKVLDPNEIEFARRYVRNPVALANRAYAGRMGNGDEASGDGWRYRGRSPVQLTFKDNYQLYGELAAVDIVKAPDDLLVPRIGARVSCVYFQHNGCNAIADTWNITAVTRQINPALAGLEERIKWSENALRIAEGR